MALVGFLVMSLHGLSSSAFAETSVNLAENSKPPLQIVKQTELKVAIQVNCADTVPNRVGKQVMAAKNLHYQYTAPGMKAGEDCEIVMLFRADGARFLLTDEAHDEEVKQPHPKGNPKGHSPQDILPYSRIVASGIGAMVDFQKSGFLPITP